MLRPVIWVSRRGKLLIMAAATPLTESFSCEQYMEWFHGLSGDDYKCPFEPKPSDWGWYGGRRVALDYSTPAWEHTPAIFVQLFLAADRGAVRQVGGVAFGLGRAVIGYGIPVKLREKTATSMRL